MPTQFERYPNSAFTYLKQPVTVGATTIVVYETRRFPQQSNFRIRIGTEAMLVTSIVDNDTLNVVRAIEGTTAKAHSENKLVISLFTNGAFDQTITDRILYAKSRPQQSKILDSTGDFLNVAGMTWDNQGGATATDVQGTVYMVGPTTGTQSTHSLLTAAPVSTPWTATLGFRIGVVNNNFGTNGFPSAGITLKNTGGARLLLFHHFGGRLAAAGAGDGGVRTEVAEMNSATSFNATVGTVRTWSHRYEKTRWMRVTDDGTTNLTFEVSVDGVNWTPYGTTGRTTWLTSGVDQVGFHVDPNTTSNGGGTPVDHRAVFSHLSFS